MKHEANNQNSTRRLQVYVDAHTDEILKQIAATGIIGSKKNEVIRYVLQEFIKNEWVKGDLRIKAKEMMNDLKLSR